MKRMMTALLVLALWAPSAAQAIRLGDAAPDFLLEDIATGSPVAMSDYLGKVTVVVFWAHW